jgi:sugar porter (SP) family MFS transporter
MKANNNDDTSPQDTSSHSTGSTPKIATGIDVETGDLKAEHEKRTKPFIVLVAVCAALGGLIFGYDIAGAGATFVMEGFQLHFGWECAEGDVSCVPATQNEIDRDQGLINGLFGAGATIGAISAPWLADNYGRRACMFTAAFIFIFGASLQTAAPTMAVMWSGRVFSGYAIGALSMCSPVYISELAPEHVRGQLATLWQVAITAGILIASAANLGLKEWDEGWRLSYGGNILFAIILIFSLMFIPESPRWLAAKSRDDDARAAMTKIRFDDEIESELEELAREVQEEKQLGVASWREVFVKDNKMRYRLLLGIGLQTTQQLCGINAIMFYAPSIFARFFSNDAAIVGTFVLNFINFASTFITIYAIERAGRVKILVSGGFIMALALVIMAVLASLDQTQKVGYVVILFSAVFVIGFAYSWGPVVWVVCAEMFPLRARGKATGLTSMSNWMWTTVVGALFPIASSASLVGCFGFFAVIITIGSIMVYAFEAETAKKTIIEIDQSFAKHEPKLRRVEWK